MLEQIKNKHLLIDGDIIKYRCAASAEKTKYLVEACDDEGNAIYDHCDSASEAKEKKEYYETSGVEYVFIWSRKEVQPVEFALQACKTTIDALLAKLSPSSVSIFLSPKKTFRDEVARTAPYKGNRTDQVKPKYLKDVEEYLINVHGGVLADNQEADDEIGIALSQSDGEGVSVSIDKDLLQIPGWHYNWVSDTVRRISPKQGDFNFYSQMLTGDVTDNIPGLPGYGPKTARDVLDGSRSRSELATRVWGEYRNKFKDTDGAAEYYLEQANLLWIRREKGEGYKCPIELQ
jgi:DNA polymerase-1